MIRKCQPNAAKDAADWVTCEEPMTQPQKFYLNTLAREAGTSAQGDLTKAKASEKIEELQEKTGRDKQAANTKGNGKA